MSTTQPHWYMLASDGMATLCADKADAEEESRTSNYLWPGRGYRAAQLVDAARIAALEAELVKEAARTAEQKLLADQMTRQHADQCAMNKELQERVQELGQMARDCSSRRVLELEAMLASVGAGGVQSLAPKYAAIPDHPPVTLINEGDMAAPAQEPLFWYRPVMGGEMYEGPHHNKSFSGITRRAEKPGEWVALYPHPSQQSVDAEQDHIRALIEQHAAILEQNKAAYFELAYHRVTGWMAWITDKPLCMPPVINADRKILAQGQGDTPDEACRDAANAAQQPVAKGPTHD